MDVHVSVQPSSYYAGSLVAYMHNTENYSVSWLLPWSRGPCTNPASPTHPAVLVNVHHKAVPVGGLEQAEAAGENN